LEQNAQVFLGISELVTVMFMKASISQHHPVDLAGIAKVVKEAKKQQLRALDLLRERGVSRVSTFVAGLPLRDGWSHNRNCFASMQLCCHNVPIFSVISYGYI